jgi:hypothetical protein
MVMVRVMFVGLAVGLFAGACGWETEDDGVARCDNVDDCVSSDDSRWDVECVHGEDQDLSTPKVCAPVFRTVSCEPNDYPADHPLRTTYELARTAPGVYVGCDVDDLGSQGCGPRPDGGAACDEGLSLNRFGACDDPAATFAAVPGSPALAGLDVLDQFCRNYFCSDEWMCDASTGTPVCRRCDGDGETLGEGACAELYTRTSDGAVRSTIYDVDTSCAENGLSSDPSEAPRLAAEKLGKIPSAG